ncbi:hypothetical protein [Janthinobacterium sp. SUN120]|uniref:hypothetical protein n=1 Tax=Janthinobacterium sp. SUN120 TaxID=3004099 RepID=UPI0025B25054|nr:hypothetical protein [Janthinobacterium sp. SUN120]MDN2716863.1 hypothetical protein [Janthinobacterium sp. SUN120]
MRLLVFLASGLLMAMISFQTFAENGDVGKTPVPKSGTAPEVNNNWSVTIRNDEPLDSPFYVAIRQAGNHWDIDQFYTSPPKLKRTEPVELFVATRDLQHWKNAYADLRTDCENFEVRESEYHSVCTSVFAEKKMAIGVLRILFNKNSGGLTPFGYTDSKVKAAINSIRPQDAAIMLAAFEQGNTDSQQQEKAVMQTQQAAKRQALAQRNDAEWAKRKAAPSGAKDWCEQTVETFSNGAFGVAQTYTCQNYGVVDEGILRNEGWAITHKQARQIGHMRQRVTVYDISIEKTPTSSISQPAAVVQQIAEQPARTKQTDTTDKPAGGVDLSFIGARKELNSMGFRFYDQDQFVDATRRGDFLTFRLFLAAGAIRPGSPDSKGVTALSVAQGFEMKFMLNSFIQAEKEGKYPGDISSAILTR